MSLDLRPRPSPASSHPASSARRNGHVGSLHALTGGERLFWEATERALRQPKDKLALVLHLSRLTPRPHHLRVARVLLRDSASRTGGQVFTMRNHDLILLCTASIENELSSPPGPASETALVTETLPAVLAGLFSADVSDATELVSIWRLDRDSEAMLAYLGERAASPDGEISKPDIADNRISVFGVQELLSRVPLAHLISRQTGMSLSPDRGRSLADRLAPAFCELEMVLPAFDSDALELPTQEDPFLGRHLASGLDAAMIHLLSEDFAAGGKLTRPAIQAGLPIHINLGLDAILSPAFARLSRHASAQGVRFGVCISLMEACADLDLMEHARRVLKLTGGDLVLSRVEVAALAFVSPTALQPDMLKLTWSRRLLGADEPLNCATRPATGLAAIDPARVVLQGVQTHEALAWGQARGITLFQGSFLSQVQAAIRMAACKWASACTLRQCCDRASAADGPSRAGCGNPTLLDVLSGPL